MGTMQHSSPDEWPPPANGDSLAVLVSGGSDSAVLLAEACGAYRRVFPVYVRTGLYWEATELAFLRRFLAAIASPTLQPLKLLDQPVADVYGTHWSMTGENVPDDHSPDEAVFLPGRNVLLLAKTLLWCHMQGIPAVALALLEANPFPDATPEFFRRMGDVVNRAVLGEVRILRPYAAMNKVEVLRRGATRPLQHTFSCMHPDGGRHCGRCNKCAERRKAFAMAGLTDPTEYARTEG